MIKTEQGIRILPLLDPELECQFRAHVPNAGRWQIIAPAAARPGRPPRGTALSWEQIRLAAESTDAVDLVLAGLSQGDLERLSRRFERPMSAEPILRSPAALVAVLTDGSLRGAELAAQMDFDGLLICPFDAESISLRLEDALARSRRRRMWRDRYEKVRRLCRLANHSRRQLREKVDLLCQDLVHSNLEFTETLHGLRRAYEFQADLMGEYDWRYLIYKALRELRADMPETNVAMYLTPRHRFEAHLTGPWFPDDGPPIEQIELLFQQTAVEQVLRTNRSLRINDMRSWRTITARQRRRLAAWALLAIPVPCEQEILGVVVFYRQAQTGFCCQDQALLERLMPSFGQALAAVRKLEHLGVS
ncbi:MAG: GAF domain-containing protein [Sedimentisphaerales bacterium]|nr:GAF domain-containing protein [Sedimentisphaerales bacterium]